MMGLVRYDRIALYLIYTASAYVSGMNELKNNMIYF